MAEITARVGIFTRRSERHIHAVISATVPVYFPKFCSDVRRNLFFSMYLHVDDSTSALRRYRAARLTAVTRKARLFLMASERWIRRRRSEVKGVVVNSRREPSS